MIRQKLYCWGKGDVALQKCTQCNTRFTWREINKTLWLAYRPLSCRKCGKNHKIQIASRLLLSLITVSITVFGIYLMEHHHFTVRSALLFIFLLTIPMSLFFPYLVKYSDDYY